MNSRRKHRPALDDLTAKNPASDVCCWFCGNTRNVPVGKYGGLCMSCFMEFQEDGIVLEVFGVEAIDQHRKYDRRKSPAGPSSITGWKNMDTRL